LPWPMSIAVILFTLCSPQLAQGLQFRATGAGGRIPANSGRMVREQAPLCNRGRRLRLSTIKPQMSLLPLCAFAIWTVGDWPKRGDWPRAFLVTLTILLAAGELLLPGWFGYFLKGIAAYRRYAPTHPCYGCFWETRSEKSSAAAWFSDLCFWLGERTQTADSRVFINILAGFLIGSILPSRYSPRSTKCC